MMNKEKQPYLVIDCETGGLDPNKHSLLSIAGVLWYPQKSIMPVFNMIIKENTLNVDNEALLVNKIDLTHLVLNGQTPIQSVTLIKHLLDVALGEERKPLTLAGHNVEFDISFLKRLYKFAEADYSKDFSHRSFDTAGILHFLQLVNEIPPEKISSDFLFKIANIEVPENQRHTAMGDAMATTKSLEYLIKTYYNPNNNFEKTI